MRFLYTNTDTITNKRHELVTRVMQTDPDVIGLVEINPKNALYDLQPTELNIPGYNLYVNSSGRGVAIFIRESFAAFEITQSDSNLPMVWCSVVLANRETMLLGIVYRSPNTNIVESQKIREAIRCNVGKKHTYVILMGDYNYPEIDWNEQSIRSSGGGDAEEFLSFVQDMFLQQKVDLPTHYRADQKPNTLDLVFTNGDDLIGKIQHLEPVGKSHHEVLLWTAVCHHWKQPTKTIKYRYDRGDYEDMRHFFSGINWEAELRDKSLDETWTFVKAVIQEANQQFVPQTLPNKRKQSNTRRAPWMNKEVREALKAKRKSYQLYRRTGEGREYDSYTRWRNKAKSEVRRAVREYERSIAESSKRNPKLFYKYVNSKIKGNSTIPDIVRNDGEMVTNNIDKAEEFNTFFCSVFTDEDPEDKPELPRREHVLSNLCDITMEREDIRKILLGLNPDKSPGPDGVHPKILKECAKELTVPLYILFSRSLKSGRIPTDWKEANITPIHKKGPRADVNNYRPISLTSTVCKVLERLVRKCILDHLFNNGLISREQHGFLPGRSCTTQLLEVLDRCTEILDRGGSVDMIYLDLAKAFDSVPHQRLLSKIRSYGIEGRVLDWLQDFLIGRLQRVMIGGEGSKWSSVASGVPQGSVLGPVLFICYINDMPEVVRAILYLYADDAKIMKEVNNESDVQSLQEDVNGLQQLTVKSLMRYNVAKCTVLHIGFKNINGKYFLSINGEDFEIIPSDVEKDLGVWMDNKLKFDTHISKITSRANQILGLVSRTFVYKDLHTMKRLYTALVRPHMEYCVVVWSPRFKKDIDRIEQVQRRATRMIPEIRHLPYEERLRKMKLPSMVYRRYRGDMITVYKYLTGRNYMSNDSLLPVANDARLRGHPYKLVKRCCNTSVRQHFFSFRVVNGWNILPEDVVTAPTLNCFKSRIDKVWGDCCYMTDPEVFGRRANLIGQKALMA